MLVGPTLGPRLERLRVLVIALTPAPPRLPPRRRCGVLLNIPRGPTGEPAPTFKCGWCYAVSARDQYVHACIEVPPAGAAAGRGPGAGAGRVRGWWRGFDKSRRKRAVDRAYVTAVSLLTGSLTLVAAYLGAALRLGAARRLVLFAGTAFMGFNVFFNYFCAVTRSPGYTEECTTLQSAIQRREQVVAGAYDGLTYCALCRLAKTPDAHHCRACGKCVIEMDHHCPFLANCVGRENLRNFMLFLFYASTGAGLAAGVGLRYILQEQQAMWRALPEVYAVYNVYYRFLLAAFSQGTFSRMSLAVYAVGTGGAVCVAVGVLFVLQMRLILEGVSYIDQLKDKEGSGQRAAWKNLRRVFGPDPLVYWFAARFRNPQETVKEA